MTLSDRVTALDGPNYDMECEIWDAIYPGERQARFEKLTAKDQPYHGRLGPADMNGYVQPLRAYTASLDHAMTLVPEDYDWAVFRTNGGLTIHAWCGSKVEHFGGTPALALCAAALRARGL